MENLELLKEKILAFSNERDWNKFHTPVNLAKSISIEANELLECFQWSDDYDINNVKEELADVFNYCIQMATKLELNITDIVTEKMKKNAKKYPIEKAKGNAQKYNQL